MEENNNAQQQFAIQRVYTKDLSFETPNSPEVFKTNWEPKVNVEINSRNDQLGEGVYEVVLTVTVTAKLEEKTAYLAEVNQAGIFTLSGFPQAQMGQMLGAYCLNILFPFAREVVADLINRGSFPQMVLAPINFDALYAQHLQQQQAQAEAGDEAENPVH